MKKSSQLVLCVVIQIIFTTCSERKELDVLSFERAHPDIMQALDDFTKTESISDGDWNLIDKLTLKHKKCFSQSEVIYAAFKLDSGLVIGLGGNKNGSGITYPNAWNPTSINPSLVRCSAKIDNTKVKAISYRRSYTANKGIKYNVEILILEN